MRAASFHILRVGMAITFLWIGILILKDPQGWGGYMQPWLVNLLPFPLRHIMLSTAILDITIGALLLIDFLTWQAALIGSLHLVIVLIASGINAITVRDLGLLAGCLSLFIAKYNKIPDIPS